MGYGTKKGSSKGSKGTKKGNKVCMTHETYGGNGRPVTPVEVAAFGI